MENLKLASILGLIALFVLAQVSSFKFNITRSRFYAPFHFAGGFLVGTLLFSLSGNFAYAVSGTLAVGLLWEAYEYLLWRFVLKKKRFKQERGDTIEDVILDIFGGLTASLILIILS